MHLWYGTDGNAPVRNALYNYRQSVESRRSFPPLPYHLVASSVESGEAALHEMEEIDLTFQLLRLYADDNQYLWDAMEPSTVSPAPLNHAIGWMIYTSLSALFPGLILFFRCL